METPNKGDSRWGSLFKNDLQGMLLPISVSYTHLTLPTT